MARCKVCFRHCVIPEGGTGFCGARTCRDGETVPKFYGKISALALDPIEKKPLNHFHPGSMILSVGGCGCNLRCPFCQNSGISWSEQALSGRRMQSLSPEELVQAARSCRDRGNIGVAYTYNEALVSYEYVRDCARLVHEAGMVNILVTNGCAESAVLDELEPFIDAMNIDLKGFTERYYRDVLGGDLSMVLSFIEKAAGFCHVELTTLIIPGENDSDDEMRALTAWIAGLKNVYGAADGRSIPLHISRFFPAFHMTDREATDVSLIYHLADLARETLFFVHTGNC